MRSNKKGWNGNQLTQIFEIAELCRHEAFKRVRVKPQSLQTAERRKILNAALKCIVVEVHHEQPSGPRYLTWDLPL